MLSCAVKRYGLSDWSTVATELQSRVHNNLFTAQICAHKFDDLKTRFSFAGDAENVGDVPWLDELKNLRIKELKEIVQGRGVSIQLFILILFCVCLCVQNDVVMILDLIYVCVYCLQEFELESEEIRGGEREE